MGKGWISGKVEYPLPSHPPPPKWQWGGEVELEVGDKNNKRLYINYTCTRKGLKTFDKNVSNGSNSKQHCTY